MERTTPIHLVNMQQSSRTSLPVIYSSAKYRKGRHFLLLLVRKREGERVGDPLIQEKYFTCGAAELMNRQRINSNKKWQTGQVVAGWLVGRRE